MEDLPISVFELTLQFVKEHFNRDKFEYQLESDGNLDGEDVEALTEYVDTANRRIEYIKGKLIDLGVKSPEINGRYYP